MPLPPEVLFERPGLVLTAEEVQIVKWRYPLATLRRVQFVEHPSAWAAWLREGAAVVPVATLISLLSEGLLLGLTLPELHSVPAMVLSVALLLGLCTAHCVIAVQLQRRLLHLWERLGAPRVVFQFDLGPRDPNHVREVHCANKTEALRLLVEVLQACDRAGGR